MHQIDPHRLAAVNVSPPMEGRARCIVSGSVRTGGRNVLEMRCHPQRHRRKIGTSTHATLSGTEQRLRHTAAIAHSPRTVGKDVPTEWSARPARTTRFVFRPLGHASRTISRWLGSEERAS